MTVQIDRIEGFAPVQAYGSVSGAPFYFRARHDAWHIEIGDWIHSEVWGDGFDASYMPERVVREKIHAAAQKFQAGEKGQGAIILAGQDQKIDQIIESLGAD